MTESFPWKIVIGIGIGLFALILGITQYVRFQTTNTQVSGHIVDNYVKTESNAGVYYIVLRLDNGQQEVFTDKDNTLQGKFDSSDVWAQLTKYRRQKQEVVLTVQGVRVPFLSWYRNVIRVRPEG